MSDYSDVLYDHRVHTHTSCVKEIANADMAILLIGARFGGTAIPEAMSSIDFDLLRKVSTKADAIRDENRFSITQLEVLKAIETNVPLFTFVDARVYAAHHLYTKNIDKPFVKDITYPPIEKPETASYIFDFIDFLSHRFSNNAVIPYNSFNDVEAHLLKQWSMLFQRLLREERDKSVEVRRADIMIEQIQDLKAAVLQSIGSGAARDIARSVLRFRRLADFLLAMRMYNPELDLFEFTGNFTDLLVEFGVIDVRATPANGALLPRTILIRDDGSHMRVRIPERRFREFAVEWNDFSQLERATKVAVLEGVEASDTVGMTHITLVSEPYEDETEVNSATLVTETEPFEMLTPPQNVGLWSNVRVQRLTELWNEGRTAGEIAAEIGGVSRNAVIGKAHRLGLQSRPMPVQGSPSPK